LGKLGQGKKLGDDDCYRKVAFSAVELEEMSEIHELL
jgi:hypothetical protein